MRRFVPIVVFVCMVLVSYKAFENPYSSSYLMSMKSQATPVSNTDNKLYQEIEEKAKEYEKPAQNAVIHQVWKKMPGLNGIVVDVEKSYKKMKKKGKFVEKELVYKQIKPEVSLEDLPAAPIFRGHPDKHVVSLNINVSWGEEYIPDILNILKKNNVKATFFIEGKWANKNVDLVKMIKDEGHEIGNHAYNHPDMAKISSEEIQKQIKQTNDILQAITGEKPKWFAPPSGSWTDEVVKHADELGMETILWTVDTIDWKKPAPEVMVNRVMNKLEGGSFVLMHPTTSVQSGLNNLILKIKQKGYTIDTVSRMLDEERLQ
ncbi:MULTISPECIES: polysaccharide deacetylase family protein [Pontibacillus]|uniref:Polysaccharide deacetylase family protein n=1 Tax=Pontibacillus chungwhensis TaxID=265426 RepID=A0ABY8V250_9BACI|nr:MULTISPECIES: polysaccharide deacetylase family protein [Pontibacillus]MCD5322733.1 polysaccharide deacetylase family protein [Pontibacillus sp. HN14]WIG00008.1 polysaccharide deacetylase family protein [Pontibacillus chungwhensis]